MRKTPVDVESPLPFNESVGLEENRENSDPFLTFVRYQGGYKCLDEFGLLVFEGKDVESFLQGQLTSDVSQLADLQGHETARLNRTGKVQGWGFLLRLNSQSFILLCHKKSLSLLKEDLEQFIIMEEVEVRESEKNPFIIVKAGGNWKDWAHADGDLFTGNFFHEDSAIFISEQESLTTFSEMTEEDFRLLMLMSAYPSFDLQGELVTNTILNDLAVSYKKGCFLGQETAAKITNNRGAAQYPVFFKMISGEVNGKNQKIKVQGKKAGELVDLFPWNQQSYALASLGRIYRVKEKTHNFETEEGNQFSGKVLYAPFFDSPTKEQKSQELYEEGLELFHEASGEEKEKQALEYLKRSIEINPKHADAYEALGVIYGRHEEHEKAIQLMDRLLEVEPNSVMAHTNKSLYLMKMGKIEEAEEEKGLATVASFKQYGEESKVKKQEEEQRKKEEQELQEREGMFYEVLEIDPDDQIANFGLGDIAYKRKEYDKAMNHLQKVLKTDDKYSQAYLLLGKCYQALGRNGEAKETFEKGVDVASKQGEMMPANEMQSRLVEMNES